MSPYQDLTFREKAECLIACVVGVALVRVGANDALPDLIDFGCIYLGLLILERILNTVAMRGRP
jgi:hypothetical protein